MKNTYLRHRRLTSLFLLFFCMFFHASAVQAGEVSFSWLPNQETTLAGYKIHYGTTPGTYTASENIGKPALVDGRVQASITGLTEGTIYYFAATAYDTDGVESSYSTEVAWKVPSAPVEIPPDAIVETLGDSQESTAPGTLSDTYTSSPGTINASSEKISTWSWSSPAPHNPANTIIMKADLSSLPPNILIAEAKLYLYQTAALGEAGYHNSVHKIIGKNPIIDQVTCENAYTNGPWTPVPAGTTANDLPLGLADIAPAEYIITLGSQPGYQAWTVTAMVQDWVNNPADNFGLLIKGAATATETGRTFAAAEGLDSTTRPKLVIKYVITATPPTVKDGTLTLDEDTAGSGQLLAEDPDGGTLTYQIVSQPSQGTLKLEESTGAYTYTPDSNAAGSDSFTFQASNGLATSSTATVSITITPINDIPVARDGSLTVLQEQTTLATLQASDADNEPLTYSIVSDPQQIVTITDQTSGEYTITPTSSSASPYTFTYKVNDGTVDSNTATVTVTLLAPGTVIESFGDTPDSNHPGMLKDTFANLNVTVNASKDYLNTWSWSTPTPHTPANTIIIKTDLTALHPKTQIAEAKLYLYQTASEGESEYENGVYKIIGKNPTIDQVTGYAASSSEEWTPVALGTSYMETPLGLADIADEPEDVITLGTQAGYQAWTITDMVQEWISNPTANFGLMIKGATMENEAGRTFAASENTDSAIRPKLVIYYSNTPPSAQDGTLTVKEDSTANGQLLAEDPDGNVLTYSVITPPEYGTLTADNTSGAYTYAPNSNVTGTDSFTFRVSDAHAAASNTATVAITITPVNDPPVAGDGSLTAYFEQTASGSLQATDIDSETLTYSIASDPQKVVTITNAATGAYTITPVTGMSSPYIFTYTVNDGTADSNTATVTVTLLRAGTVIASFGDTPDSTNPGTLTDTYTDLKENINASADHINTWSWSSATPHKPANTIIIKADISTLPQNILITGATLTLYQSDSYGEGEYVAGIHKIISKNPVIQQVSGKNAGDGNAWNPVPAGTTENDVPLGLADIGPAEHTTALGTTPGFREWTITEMVQDWVNNPAANFGLLIAGTTTQAEAGRSFAATENQDSAVRPKLIIHYIKRPPSPSVNSAIKIQ